MTKQNSSQKSACTGCIGKFVLLLWVLIVGIIGGGWLGFNFARMYPAWNIPQLPMLENVPMASRSVQADDGLHVTVTEVKRTGQRLDVYFVLLNNGNSPIDPSRRDFHLRDGRQRSFKSAPTESGIEDVLLFLDPLNPGLSSEHHLVFKIPTDARGLKLMYKDAGASVSW